MPTLTTTNAGFHTVGPLGDLLAPNVFLRTPLNIAGSIVSDADGATWQSAESLRYDGWTITPDAVLAAHNPGAATVTVTAIRYARAEGDGLVTMGTLDLGAGLTVAATLQQDWRSGLAMWQADLGAALDDLVRDEGVRFLGGDGADVFAPHLPVWPIRGEVTILGRGGDDRLTGSLADDLICGGAGDDVLADLSGTNRLFGGSGDDTVTLGLWSDGSLARGGSGNDTLVSGNGSDRIMGNAGDDRLTGGRGDDTLAGGDGTDRLDGGDGDDRLIGGRGGDTLTGGRGADLFRFRTVDSGRDTVTDFTVSEDTLRLAGWAGGFDGLLLTDTQQGTLVAWGNDHAGILLAGVSAATLGEGDFLF